MGDTGSHRYGQIRGSMTSSDAVLVVVGGPPVPYG